MSNTSKIQQATAFIMFSAMAEIMLSMYENTTFLIHYDPSLHTKLKNLKTNFERVSAKAYQMFPEDEQLIFFDLIRIFESLLKSAVDHRDFSELVNMIKAWEKGDLSVINSINQLKQLSNMIDNKEKNIG